MRRFLWLKRLTRCSLLCFHRLHEGAVHARQPAHRTVREEVQAGVVVGIGKVGTWRWFPQTSDTQVSRGI